MEPCGSPKSLQDITLQTMGPGSSSGQTEDQEFRMNRLQTSRRAPPLNTCTRLRERAAGAGIPLRKCGSCLDGPRTTDHGPRTTDHGPQTTNAEPRTPNP